MMSLLNFTRQTLKISLIFKKQKTKEMFYFLTCQFTILIIRPFGVVFKGKLIKEDTITDVAIKSLKD